MIEPFEKVLADHEDLAKSLVVALTSCESNGLPFQKIDLDQKEAIATFVLTLVSHGVTAADVAAVTARLCALKQFPIPYDVIELTAELVEARRQIQLKPASAKNGMPLMVLDGPRKALPDGKRKARAEA